MYIATTKSPDPEMDKEDIRDNMLFLLKQSCDYLEEFEKMGTIKEGIGNRIFDKIRSQIERDWHIIC